MSDPASDLTRDEHEAVRLAGELYQLLERIVDRGPTREDDLRELRGHIHGIQHAVMAQAAGRQHPKTFRLLGRAIPRLGFLEAENDTFRRGRIG